MKAATKCPFNVTYICMISIHAAREGGDGMAAHGTLSESTFQSTPPVKAATHLLPLNVKRKLFQSTPPVKAATRICR